MVQLNSKAQLDSTTKRGAKNDALEIILFLYGAVSVFHSVLLSSFCR